MKDMEKNGVSIRRKVLVVDDERINQEILKHIIEQNYDVLCAGNGQEALEILQNNPGTISLIMLDLLMPVMDGFSLLEILKKDEILKRIPVIVLTSEKAAEVKALEAGAVDFIPKPYDMPVVILARVNRSIELAEDAALVQENERDDITGLYSKGFFLKYVSYYDLYEAGRAMDAISININRFRIINEIHGRHYGDQVLASVAEGVKDLFLEKGGLACRCEADSFLAYVPHFEDHQERIDAFEKAFAALSGNNRITFCVGIYENADQDPDIERRFDRAIGSRRSKKSYHTTCCIYNSEVHDREMFDERLIMEMDKALEERQFCVFYQPKYDIRREKNVLRSAEALIRWNHPEFGMLSPGRFIPLFEENGLAKKLDRFVWNRTAEQIREWKETFGKTIPVSVNVSRMDIYDGGLEEELLAILKAHGLKPEELLLEITESAYTDNSEQIIETVKHLREIGFKVEMDDFGSGYSSLNMLADLPIDALKLDMRFMKNIATSEKDLRMVKLMLDIAAYLQVEVIAEGVETEEQYRLLKEAGCDIIQGYYFSRPVPPEEFETFIRMDAK